MIAVQLTATTALVVAVFLRSESWCRPQTRPMTLMLTTSAVYVILSMEWVNGRFNEVVSDVHGWNNLPQLASSLTFMAGFWFLMQHILNAADRPDLMCHVRSLTAAITAVLVTSYALAEAPFLDQLPATDSPGMALHWITLAFASCLSNGAMLVCIYQAMDHQLEDRVVLMAYQFAASVGLLAAGKRILESTTPLEFGSVITNGHLIYICLIGYACASILNYYVKQNSQQPIREQIDGMG